MPLLLPLSNRRPTSFRDVIHEQRPHRSPVVGAGDGAVPFLTCRVPDLGLDGFPVHLSRAHVLGPRLGHMGTAHARDPGKGRSRIGAGGRGHAHDAHGGVKRHGMDGAKWTCRARAAAQCGGSKRRRIWLSLTERMRLTEAPTVDCHLPT